MPPVTVCGPVTAKCEAAAGLTVSVNGSCAKPVPLVAVTVTL